MNCRGNIFILYWQVRAVSATEDQLACRCLPLLTLLLKCGLHDLIALIINLSQTPPGFGDPVTPPDLCTPEDTNRDLMETWSMLLATVCVCVWLCRAGETDLTEKNQRCYDVIISICSTNKIICRAGEANLPG